MISHTRGLRQGDPRSSMLLLLVTEVLGALIRKANDWAMLQPLGVRSILHRTSLYTDDLVLFLSSTAQDLQLTKCILSLFEGASGLACNVQKCQMTPIHCDTEQCALATSLFPCQAVNSQSSTSAPHFQSPDCHNRPCTP
jgi:hypothetical protein